MGKVSLTSRRFLFLRLLRVSLLAGAFYDFVFATLMLAAPELPGRLLGLPLPGEAFYLWLMAIFLYMLGLLYLAAAMKPRRYTAVIAVAVAGRLAGALAFTVAAFSRPDLAGLYPLAAADFLFAAAHLCFWVPLRQ